jgi:Phycobilisome degradation protein nblA
MDDLPNAPPSAPMPGDLTMEQQFKLQTFRCEVANMSLSQAQDLVVEITRQMMVKDNLIKHVMRNGVC